jgi:acyl-coenzyme A synthetase/AMP-(fatty) acid ligase
MIVDRIYFWAMQNPDKTAVIVNGRSVTYGQFARAIDATGERFQTCKLPATGTALIFSEDFLDAWLKVLALRQLGLQTLCVLPWFPMRDLNISRPDIIVPASRRQRLALSARHLFSGTRVLPEWNAAQLNLEGRPSPMAGETAHFGDMLLLSSGTTGRYKVLAAPGSQIEHTHRAVVATYGVSCDSVFNFHWVGPWTGMGGRTLPSVWICGGTVIFDSTPNWASNLFQHGTNQTFLAPTDVPMVAAAVHPAFKPNDFCRIIVGGGFLSERNARHLEELEGCKSLFFLAASETAGALMAKELLPAGDDTEHWLSPVGGRTLETVDDDGKRCPRGTEGRLRVLLQQGDCRHYVGDATASAKAFVDGYFYSGDSAVMREDGCIRVIGRDSDVVILNSQKMAAAPIEAKIRKELGIEAVCAFSGLGVNGEEELAIALEVDALPTQDRLDVVARLLPPFESVRWAAIPSFPRTELGLKKIRRKALRALLFRR